MSDLPARARSEAVEKINWYAMRWKIEVFHKIFKSGCCAEDSKLRTPDRLADLMAAFCILQLARLLVNAAESHRAECRTFHGVGLNRDQIARSTHR